MNTQICTGVTALTLDSGEVVISEFGQGQWFGNCMDKSIINPNQCRMFGIKIYDELTNPYKKLEIEAYEGLFIPIKTKVSNFGLITHTPTKNEIHECQLIFL